MEEFLLRLHQKPVSVDSKDRLVWLETMCMNSKLNPLIFFIFFLSGRFEHSPKAIV